MSLVGSVLVLVVLIAGCASEPVTLVNDKGESWYCTKRGGGELTQSARTRDFDNCLNAAGMQGFKRVDQ